MSFPGPDADRKKAVNQAIWNELNEAASGTGLIAFPNYMDIALYGEHGYYQRRATLGGRGADFFTAAQFPLFGRCLGKYLLGQWQQNPVAQHFQQMEIVEFGPGQGELAAAVGEYLEAVAPGELSIRYTLVEPSQHLRQVQFERLTALSGRINWEWANDIETVGSRNSHVFVLANELLDALPVEIVRRTTEGWQRGYVKVSNHQNDPLQFEWRPAEVGLAQQATAFTPVPVGQRAELCLEYERVFKACADLADSVHAVFIDYGIFRDEWEAGIRPSGTLRGFARHEWTDPLQTPGWSDITADVNWNLAVARAKDCGFMVQPIQSQAAFLMAAGIAEMAEQNLDRKTVQALKTLVLPGGMGERFSVLTCEVTRGGASKTC